jgi:hypothetical protein
MITKRWEVRDRYGNDIYLSEKAWEHVVAPENHPEMADYEEHLCETLRKGRRRQDLLNPRKYRYSVSSQKVGADPCGCPPGQVQDLPLPQDIEKIRYSYAFDDLYEDNTHVVAIVLFRFGKDESGQIIPNNYVVTAFQKEIG